MRKVENGEIKFLQNDKNFVSAFATSCIKKMNKMFEKWETLKLVAIFVHFFMFMTYV